MIQIKPFINSEFNSSNSNCNCNLEFKELKWQGVYIGVHFFCNKCITNILFNLPTNQGIIDKFKLVLEEKKIFYYNNIEVKPNWSSDKFFSILNPIEREVKLDVLKIKPSKKVIILNTLDFIYGHSLLFLFNLQQLIKNKGGLGIIVLIQPMMKWLLPSEGISEVWTVNLGFNDLKQYYPNLSNQINKELLRFDEVNISAGHIIPTNNNINIETFTSVKPFSFEQPTLKPRITFIWREDPGRLMIRNIYVTKFFQKLGFKKILLPIHYLKVRFLFYLLRKSLPENYEFTIAGLGKFGKFPNYIKDERVMNFLPTTERKLCEIYSESVLVIGIHGSSMLLPSAHAGMTISLMPSKRWGNFQEDILLSETDARLALFQKRILPLNLSLFEIKDIIIDMIKGRAYFTKKFIHSEKL